MEIEGKISEVLPEKTGQSANGSWRKQEYVLETEGQYPKKICFMAWGDRIDQFKIKHGEHLVVSVDLESREYNGRWYTDVKSWKISRSGSEVNDFQPSESESYETAPSTSSSFSNEDIPF